MTTMTPATTTVVPEPQEARAMNTTTTTTTVVLPLAGFSAEQLNRLAGLFLAPGLAPVAVGVAGHSVGRPEVDEVIVAERDLWFLHGLDAARFGAHEDCVLCAHEAADRPDDEG